MQEMIENQSSVDGPKSDASDATAKDEIKVPEGIPQSFPVKSTYQADWI